MAPRIRRLRLVDFRNYPSLDLRFQSPLVALAGPNGAGKTNILEALSLLSPGRGLRRAPLALMERQGAAGGFAILADLAREEGEWLLATALQAGESQRQCRIEREKVDNAQRFLEFLGLLWLTPDQDGLFRGPPGDRRRFLDRLVLAVDAMHGARANAYEKALRHRNRLLEEARTDARWLDAIERELAELGVALAAARLETVQRLDALSQSEAERIAPFPFARLSLSGDIEALLRERPAREVEDRFARLLEENRPRDRLAGRTLIGPHAADLSVIHGPKDEAANLCSTGEQKALLIGILLAQTRLIGQMRGEMPILLLDEIAAHLDVARRHALYRMLTAMGGQAFLTGTDSALFEGLGSAGEVVALGAGQVFDTPLVAGSLG